MNGSDKRMPGGGCHEVCKTLREVRQDSFTISDSPGWVCGSPCPGATEAERNLQIQKGAAQIPGAP